MIRLGGSETSSKGFALHRSRRCLRIRCDNSRRARRNRIRFTRTRALLAVDKRLRQISLRPRHGSIERGEHGAHLSERTRDSKLKVRTKPACFPSAERGSLPGIRSVAWPLTVQRTPQNVRLFHVKFSPSCSPRRARGGFPLRHNLRSPVPPHRLRGKIRFAGVMGHADRRSFVGRKDREREGSLARRCVFHSV